ncbi:MAG: glutathione S-transferase family protein [Myxococcota bacterium]
MKLYTFPVAPNPTRVRLYLAEKRQAGAEFEIEEVSVSLPDKEHRSAAHRARNPLARLPVLEIAEGQYLTESAAIIEYLEELLPEPVMIGATAHDRARTRELDRIIDLGILLTIGGIVHATKSPLGFPPNPEAAANARAALSPNLALVEERLSDGRPFLMGSQPSIADCTLAAALQFGRLFGFEMPETHEAIARWDGNFRERVSAKQVLVG